MHWPDPRTCSPEILALFTICTGSAQSADSSTFKLRRATQSVSEVASAGFGGTFGGLFSGIAAQLVSAGTQKMRAQIPEPHPPPILVGGLFKDTRIHAQTAACVSLLDRGA